MYNLIMSKGGNDNTDDAMFSTKPLGGLSCASCEKGLVDMHGKRVEFMPWNKMPFRDPAERIARVGQGFSKMLSMINPDQLSRYEQQNSKTNMNQQQMHMSQNDPMPNQNDPPFYDPNGEQSNPQKTYGPGRFPSQQRMGRMNGRPGSEHKPSRRGIKNHKM